MTEISCPSAQDTFAFGDTLGRCAGPGTVVALIGELGAGKTVIARGVGAGLGVKTRVQSPTFILVQNHEGGRLPFWHADLYRLTDLEELEQIGLDEQLGGAGVVLIEWADRFPEWLPADRLEVRIEDDGEGRRLTIVGTGPRHAALESSLVW
jgi:tRNA threonylcarbamoyladenosine biosynthesis protein TsaE